MWNTTENIVKFGWIGNKTLQINETKIYPPIH